LSFPVPPPPGYNRGMSERTCPMCGAAATSTGKCLSCGEDLPPLDGKRRAHLPMLPPIEVFTFYPIALVAIVVALLLPLIAWLRHLLNGF
jgi:hypothetical protein